MMIHVVENMPPKWDWFGTGTSPIPATLPSVVPTGWECPRCKAIVSPHEKTCPCSPPNNQVTPGLIPSRELPPYTVT